MRFPKRLVRGEVAIPQRLSPMRVAFGAIWDGLRGKRYMRRWHPPGTGIGFIPMDTALCRRSDLIPFGIGGSISPPIAQTGPGAEKRSRMEGADDMDYDPECYLCPGNTRATGDVNPRLQGRVDI